MSLADEFRKKAVEKIAENLVAALLTILTPIGLWLLHRVPAVQPYFARPVPAWVVISIVLPLVLVLLLVSSIAARRKGTLRIAQKPAGNCWWSMGKVNGEPSMQIVGHLFVTNVSSAAARIPQAELHYGFLGRKQVSGMVMVAREWLENYYGIYDIPPGETRDVSFDFWLSPPIVRPTEKFTPHSIVLVDQLGNRHILRKVEFESMAARMRPQPKEPEEFPYEIADPIEKEVVSVLKAELARYGMCGRTVGGLGSIHIVYQGRAFTGVGGDGWTPNSSANQVIASDPESAALKSDNLEALVTYYGGLGSDDEKARFTKALLDRLDRTRGYLMVSYFIVAVCLRVGILKDGLRKARLDLPEGETSVFGLSNVLMLLNGLLRYRYPDFTNEMLDEIERLIHGLNEHPFMIPAKLAAIRAQRLNTKNA